MDHKDFRILGLAASLRRASFQPWDPRNGSMHMRSSGPTISAALRERVAAERKYGETVGESCLLAAILRQAAT